MTAATRQRDIRLDFFRGLAMFIIFMAHMPGNRWSWYIPAQYGPSDGAEMFVFCSGFASAIAFGGVFMRAGFRMGIMRVLFRCWQILWAHIGLFLTIAAICVLGTRMLDAKDYVGWLNLHPFFDDPMSGIIGLLTLTYVPNFFDILPMYFVVLLLMPVVMALSRIHVGLVAVFCFGLWAANWVFGFDLPAEWWSDREWFFSPFGWQLIFFTGFAFGSGWLRPPPVNRWLILAALAFVLACVPFDHYPIYKHSEFLTQWNHWLTRRTGEFGFQGIEGMVGFSKTDYGILRWVHFLCLAYLVHGFLSVVGVDVLRAKVFKPIVKVGQQALPTFITSIMIAVIGGMALDVFGRDALNVAAANLTGFAILIGAAYFVAEFKQQPWRKPKPAPAAPEPEPKIEQVPTIPLGRQQRFAGD